MINNNTKYYYNNTFTTRKNWKYPFLSPAVSKELCPNNFNAQNENLAHKHQNFSLLKDRKKIIKTKNKQINT